MIPIRDEIIKMFPHRGEFLTTDSLYDLLKEKIKEKEMVDNFVEKKYDLQADRESVVWIKSKKTMSALNNSDPNPPVKFYIYNKNKIMYVRRMFQTTHEIHKYETDNNFRIFDGSDENFLFLLAMSLRGA
ncbi:MAG: hypothetical protein AABY22_10335 [Nanoarchaeota archaeon]